MFTYAYRHHIARCLSIFTFSTNPLGKWKERLGRSNTGFALWMMRWYEGERMMIFEVSLIVDGVILFLTQNHTSRSTSCEVPFL